MTSDIVRVRAVARGRVQMVGFRAFVQRHAAQLGLGGSVRNAPDGTVVCELQGAREAVEQMLARLNDGPLHARVDRVDVEPLEPVADAPSMRVTA
ncbi:MAG: acylphosphatase [Candidatus Dormibacteraeota bacterium]|nr:acylphosphatase [Candidatus Dormibacteraeota bacterium]MBV9526117.1 acylphosphatase [Candidatus Dormibacteraeota bacterium]